jgi:multiple sugar transport system permease protein
MKKTGMHSGWKQLAAALPYLLPGLVLMALFILYPLVRNIIISFSEFNTTFPIH